MTIVRVERIRCDNPECIAYADELIREQPDGYELEENIRALVSLQGWTSRDGFDFCPSHSAAKPL